jgi:DNA-binding PadR family transcriptional regulator
LDVRTLCLGILIDGDATGYDIKKALEENSNFGFIEASFGSIYPTLAKLAEEGLLTVRAEGQGARNEKKTYSITPAGEDAFVSSLLQPLSEDKYRSPFLFVMMFAERLPRERVRALIDRQIAAYEAKREMVLAKLAEPACTPGERFVCGIGLTSFDALLDYLRTHRHDIESAAASERLAPSTAGAQIAAQ